MGESKGMESRGKMEKEAIELRTSVKKGRKSEDRRSKTGDGRQGR